MIQIIIEMEPATNSLDIKAVVPVPIALAVVTAAYHELLSRKVQEDLKAGQRIIEVRRPLDNGGLR